ncbi:MAG: DUF624 domain-containing protein [Bifidobacterium sp.]|jgi:uncharacterized membrane protein YesL|nr:DUF624 domain-containing protein [Bifidobacterium sp.]MCI1864870.1 DUF624 domain-containing protein [Bifidobacterium sp.]
MSWLSPDSTFMQGLSKVVDTITINAMLAVCSLPVVTIGAALAAAHDASRRLAESEGHVVRNYCTAFRSNCAKACILWIPFAIGAAALIYGWIAVRTPLLLAPVIGLTLLWLIGFEWVFAMQARFENPVGTTLRNAFIIGFAHIGWTVLLMAIDAAALALLSVCFVYAPQALFPLAVLGYGSLIGVHTPILEHVFAPYVHPDGHRESGS